MPEGLDIDFDALGAYERYKLMASLIVPRPIALVTTTSPDGVVNAAPFSMFGMVGEDPPLLMISVNRLEDGAQKDTAANLDATGEFVVHIPDEAMAARMHQCGQSYPADVDELAMVGLTATPAHRVRPPRIAEAPVAFECTVHERILTTSRQVYLGQIHHLHAAPGLIDTDRWRVTLQDFHPVGRFGASFYVTTGDRFSLASDAAGTPVSTTDIDQL